ncbi:thiamine pyrophosphate-dependent enzyme [Kamptonema cortianum]|nr:thiamine pyrophosphate-dependent enzyme [Geitlerinema splendidum]MDK3160403.1 thiamine pyrophosphate-dependent enzyme [Kamptonema cortianum]
MSVISQSKPFVKLDFLRLMMESREGDRREGILLRQSKGWFQVSGMGHEAIGAVCHLMGEDDWLYPYYRDRGLMLSRGLTTYDLALAYFAKRASSSGGRQMPGHYSSAKHKVMSVCTPTGGGLIPAAGTAWGIQLDGKQDLVFATVGDAAMRQGEFFEAWAFAVQEKLPLIIAIEDNKYGISTPTDKFMALNIPGILSNDLVVKCDGRRTDDVLKSFGFAADRARNGGGPTLMWIDLDRLSSHTSSDDHRVYRDQEEIEAMAARDPIVLLRNELIESGELTMEQFEQLQTEIVAEVDEAYRRAEKEQDPSADEVMDHCWGMPDPVVSPPIETGNQTMVEAINKTLRKAVEDDPDVIFFGEDIEDPKGGVFKLTEGLSENFPKQVFNSPLAEATIIGVAVGLAAYGKKPVFELQFVDFFCPAWNQIMTNVSTTRWRSAGDWKTPMVVYAPYGAYLPGGSLWHSQSNEAYFAHTPGLKLAIPSTPEDAAGLFWTAVHSDDPCFIFVPKHIFRKRVDVNSVEPVPFGKARVQREGNDVTIVSYGNTLELAHEAAAKLDGEISIEIIDLRSLVPLDIETVTKSVEKTGRLVVIQEDTRTCGYGGHVISEMTSDPDRFSLFLASPQLVSRPDVHIGYNPIYEYAALPDLDEVIKACRVTME